MSNEFDYSEFAPQPAGNNILQRLAQLADQYDRLSVQAKEAEANSKAITDQLNRLKRVDIPEAMEEAGMSKCTTSTGRTITVETKPVGNIPSPTTTDPELAEKRVRILKWINDSGFGKIMKHELRVAFDQAHEAEAKRLAEELDEQGFETVDYSTIHPATYGKLLRELVSEGVDLPEFMGVTMLKEAKVK